MTILLCDNEQRYVDKKNIFKVLFDNFVCCLFLVCVYVWFFLKKQKAMWVIDKLALRVGNEKGEDEADTVCFFFFFSK